MSDETWVKQMKSTLCGMFPRWIEVKDADNRTVVSARWRGGRAAAVAILESVAPMGDELTFRLTYGHYVWQGDAPRKMCESAMDFTNEMNLLKHEQEARLAAAKARVSRRVRWRPA